MPNVNLKYSHFVELLHNFLVSMVTVFLYQQGKPVMSVLLKKVCAILDWVSNLKNLNADA